MQKKTQPVRKFHMQHPALWMVLAVLFLTVAVGGVIAKYIQSDAGENLFYAKEFYFTSNLLEESCPKYTLNNTATQVSFTLNNHADALRYSEDTINFTVSVTCKDALTAGKEPVLSATEGMLAGGKCTDTNVTLSNLVQGKTYIVTAHAEAGYELTIQAEFYVSDEGMNLYKHLDASNTGYVLLTIWAENLSGSLELRCNKVGVIPDNTDPVMQSVYNYKNSVYETFSFTDSKNFTSTYASYVYRFFDGGAVDLTEDDFVVTLNGSSIAETAALP